MKLGQRQDTVIASVTSREVLDDGTTISAQSEMGRYGMVRFTINLESSGDRTGGKAYGGGRGALEDGSFLSGTFSGRWRREGTEVVVYGIDEVSNGDMSMLIFRLDARGNDVSVTHYASD